MNIRKSVFLGVLAAVTTPSFAASPGDFDPTFGGDGKVVTDFSGNFDFDIATSIAIQKDGKIVVAGYEFDPGHGNNNFVLARYTTSGALDSSFGAGGKVVTDFDNSSFDQAFGVAVQADGKIVVAGLFSPNGSIVSDFALARYNTNGTPDTTFGGDGKVTTDFAGNDDEGLAVAIQPADGKILVAGFSGVKNVHLDYALARYNTNGTLDKTFHGDGRVTTNFGGGGADGAFAIALQKDGKIVVAGQTAATHLSVDFGLARYNINGTLDASFGGNGKVITDFGNENLDEGFAVAIQPNGKIVAAGLSSPSGSSVSFALARYNTNGALDRTFSGDGKVLTNFTSGSKDQAFALAIQPDGKIVAAGVSDPPTGDVGNFALARYTPIGALDILFSGDGKLTTNFDGGGDEASAIAIQKDGKIVTAGVAFTSSFTNVSQDFGVARYRNFFCRGQDVTKLGTAGNDVLNGTVHKDVINGLSGNDILRGFDGNDQICGGTGDDILIGGNGSDFCDGGAGTADSAAACEIQRNIP